MDAVRCCVDKQPIRTLAGALKRSANYQTDYISNRLMLGREVMGPEVIIEVKS